MILLDNARYRGPGIFTVNSGDAVNSKGTEVNKGSSGAFAAAACTSGATETEPRQKIAFFVGSDVTALMIVNKVIPALRRKGLEPVIFFPKEGISKRHEREGALGFTASNYRFFERQLLHKVVGPYLVHAGIPNVERDNKGRPPDNFCLPADQLGEFYDIQVQKVDDINDPDFVAGIESDPAFIGAISIRCYQIFKGPLIRAFESKNFQASGKSTKPGFVWNEHPGPLPRYRGFLHPPHVINNGDEQYLWTLHKLIFDPELPHNGIDAGPIIDVKFAEISDLQETEGSTSPIVLYTGFAEAAAQTILENLKRVRGGYEQTLSHQDIDAGQYYNYVQLSELEDRLKNGDPKQLQRLQPDPDYMRDLYVRRFTRPGTPQRHYLYVLIDQAISDWENRRTFTPFAPQGAQQPREPNQKLEIA
jgi:hypothetical protein